MPPALEEDSEKSQILMIILVSVGVVALLTITVIGLYCYKKGKAVGREESRMDSMIYNKNRQNKPKTEVLPDDEKMDHLLYKGPSGINHHEDDSFNSGRSPNGLTMTSDPGMGKLK